MYYINNNVYVADLRNMVTVISGNGNDGFEHRKIYYVTDNEGFLPMGDLERELNYRNLEFITVPSTTDIKTLGKCIVVYDDDRANSYPYSHYKTVFTALGLSSSLFDGYAETIGLSKVDKKGLVKVSVSSEDSKDIPLDLLLYVLSKDAMNKQTTEMLQEKLLINVNKIKTEQVTIFINSHFSMIKHLIAKNNNFAEVVIPFMVNYNTPDNFDAFVDIVKQEETNLAEFISSIELEDLVSNYDIKELCDKILTNEDYTPLLKSINNDTSMCYLSKRQLRLNYIRI